MKPEREAPARAGQRVEGDDGDEGPFPDFSRPLEEECRVVTKALVDIHGDPRSDWQREEDEEDLIHGLERPLEVDVSACGGRTTVLDALVGTILSQNTTDKTSHRVRPPLLPLCAAF